MKRDWNQSADKLAGTALHREDGEVVTSEEDKLDLIALNRLDELLIPQSADFVAHVAAVTGSARRRRVSTEVLQEEIVQRTRSEHILQAQNEERWIVDLKAYLKGEVGKPSSNEAKNCAKVADDYELDELDLLFDCPATAQTDGDSDLVARLVVPETLQQNFLHYYHTSLEGGHQGIGRTYHRIRAQFHWRGLYRIVQRYVGDALTVRLEKDDQWLKATRQAICKPQNAFQMIAMDHIPSLPKSFKGNTELLIWVDLFSGYVIAKASASRTAQTAPKNYEECAFRRFGASEVIVTIASPGLPRTPARSDQRPC
ncbi:hypothetical protein PR003_g15751 [Phytophthora rubi]|uniref:Integrase zinc-binding domain-containing protein n=1 Tax=Phytophthora rubi TaxID=129364 RepID=A0A6A3N9X7_9STRA|nr:hypothetical protein PR002_g10473 [Phytophthora rubi]KAE9040389.1 hypothetical protein PR001_g7092 [Phytophthora rubi]KAE9328598.1 hypothetical protein PR003_g15751 [Phytophthora rubi]